MKFKAVSLLWLTVAAISLVAIGFSFRGPLMAVESIDSLKEKQSKIRKVIEETMPATVAVTDGIGSGSGVIVSEDGLVLTAAHVLLTGGEEFELIFANGRRVSATPLGKNLDVDAGMLKINEPGPWPFVPLADLKKVEAGDWCVALGYPGGYQLGRTPPVRVGRVLANARTVLMSDSALIGGDSGGPLFNLDGEVIGIHSSIGATVDQNRHVPVALFQRDWEELVGGETWGRLGSKVETNPNRPMLGIQMEQLEDGIRVAGLLGDSPAKKAGVEVGDKILTIDDQKIARMVDVLAAVNKKQGGDVVSLKVERDGKILGFKVELTTISKLNLPEDE